MPSTKSKCSLQKAKKYASKYTIDQNVIPLDLFHFAINVEMEHAHTVTDLIERISSSSVPSVDVCEVATKIVIDHLLEFPDYYQRLKKLETQADKEWEGKDKPSIFKGTTVVTTRAKTKNDIQDNADEDDCGCEANGDNDSAAGDEENGDGDHIELSAIEATHLPLEMYVGKDGVKNPFDGCQKELIETYGAYDLVLIENASEIAKDDYLHPNLEKVMKAMCQEFSSLKKCDFLDSESFDIDQDDRLVEDGRIDGYIEKFGKRARMTVRGGESGGKYVMAVLAINMTHVDKESGELVSDGGHYGGFIKHPDGVLYIYDSMSTDAENASVYSEVFEELGRAIFKPTTVRINPCINAKTYLQPTGGFPENIDHNTLHAVREEYRQQLGWLMDSFSKKPKFKAHPLFTKYTVDIPRNKVVIHLNKNVTQESLEHMIDVVTLSDVYDEKGLTKAELDTSSPLFTAAVIDLTEQHRELLRALKIQVPDSQDHFCFMWSLWLICTNFLSIDVNEVKDRALIPLIVIKRFIWSLSKFLKLDVVTGTRGRGSGKDETQLIRSELYETYFPYVWLRADKNDMTNPLFLLYSIAPRGRTFSSIKDCVNYSLESQQDLVQLPKQTPPQTVLDELKTVPEDEKCNIGDRFWKRPRGDDSDSEGSYDESD